MKTLRSFGSFLTRASRVIGQGFLAFFRFTEEDARILGSANGFHAPEIEHLRDKRSVEDEENPSHSVEGEA